MILKTIIVEDISAAANVLAKHLLAYSEVQLQAICYTKVDAIAQIKQLKPDLLFLDINLGKDSGFEILDNCSGYFKYVIFTTAHSEFVIQSFKYMTVHYLLKPINPKDLNLAMDKIKNLHLAEPIQTAQPISSKKIFYSEKGFWKFIHESEIIYLESKRSYCNIHTKNNLIQLSKNLSKVIESLGPDSIIKRTHKSFAVNINEVNQIKRGLNSYVVLTNNKIIPVSLLHKNELFELIKFS